MQILKRIDLEHEPKRVGCVFLGVFGDSDRSYTIGCARQRIEPVDIRAGDELLILDGPIPTEFIVRPVALTSIPPPHETAGNDPVPIFKIISNPIYFAPFHGGSGTTTKLRHISFSRLYRSSDCPKRLGPLNFEKITMGLT